MHQIGQTFTIGIIGMGLIGGSIARAYREAGHRVYIRDLSAQVCEQAMACGAADGDLDRYLDDGGRFDCIFIALYPEATVTTLAELAPRLDKGTLVMDTCGIKRYNACRKIRLRRNLCKQACRYFHCAFNCYYAHCCYAVGHMNSDKKSFQPPFRAESFFLYVTVL